MKNASSSMTIAIPLLGDTTCPWFDPLWLHVVKTQRFRICTDPHQPSSDTSSGLKHLERQIDLDNLEVVAAHAGKKAWHPAKCWFQEVLIREGNVWSVLNRQAHRIELRLLFDSDDSTKGPADVVPEREQYVCHIATLPSIFVDEESNNSTVEFQEQRLMEIREHLQKDRSYLKVAEWLEEREYVDSRYWPRLVHRFPFLAVSIELLRENKTPRDSTSSSGVKQRRNPNNDTKPQNQIDEEGSSITWNGVKYTNIPPNAFQVLLYLFERSHKDDAWATIEEVRKALPDIISIQIAPRSTNTTSRKFRSVGLAEVFSERPTLNGTRKRGKFAVWEIVKTVRKGKTWMYRLTPPGA